MFSHGNFDMETGEIDYMFMRSMLLNTSQDKETGEYISHYDDIGDMLSYKFSKFKIPNQLIKKPDEEIPIPCEKIKKPPPVATTVENCLLKTSCHTKETIMLGFKKTSHLLCVLIPLLFYFFHLTAILITMVEMLLHIYAHRKNATTTNPYVNYITPLHLVTSQFCAMCRAQEESKKIGQMQKESLNRRNRFRLKFTLRGVTQSLG